MRAAGSIKARSAGLVLASAAALAAGCEPVVHPAPRCDYRAVVAASPPPGPVLVSPVAGAMTPMPLNAVNVTDYAISNKVMVQATNARRLEGGDIEVFARVVNCTDYPLQIEARTHFLDAGQNDAEPVTAWSRLYLQAHSLASYDARSTAGASVDSYLIELREGR